MVNKLKNKTGKRTSVVDYGTQSKVVQNQRQKQAGTICARGVLSVYASHPSGGEDARNSGD